MSMRRRLTAAVLSVLLASPLLIAAAMPAGAAPTATVATKRAVGKWTVTQIGPQTYRVAWRAPERLPLGADRPQIRKGDTSLGVALVERDGRTVYVDVQASRRPDPTAFDVVLSGDRLNISGDDVAARSGAAKTSGTKGSSVERATTTLPDDPATPGAFNVQTSDYELDPVKLPGMPEPIEMVGHVVEPVDGATTGPRPVVLFLHGRHSYCYNPKNGRDGWKWPCMPPFKEIPSHLGYDYIQQVLASQGYFTVSVRVNGINAQDFALDDGGADARAQIVERHLDYWADQATDHQLDMSEVVLVGHSRGGEGVDRASLEIPLSAPYTIAGQVLLAPTDFAGQTAAYVPTVTMLPYCDGDVYDLQGQLFTDTARDLTNDDTSLKSSVLVMGANHNFFNTEWTPGLAEAPAWDDWGDTGSGLCGEANPDRLTPIEQQAVGTAYVSGAVHLFTRDEEEFLPMYDGSAVNVTSTGDAEVFSHAIGGGRVERRPGVDSGLSLADGADTQLCLGAVTWSRPRHGLCGRVGDLDGNVPHWSGEGDFLAKRKNLEVEWSAPGQTGGLVFDDPLDLSGGQRLELRTIVDPLVGDVAFTVRLTDADGHQADVVPEGGSALAALPSSDWLGKRWGQTVIVDPSTAAGIDLSEITQVDLVAESNRGHVWVLDMAAAPDQLAGVPNRRLPVVSLGKVKVAEGNRQASTAKVPFTVSGTLTRPATVAVGQLTDGEDLATLTMDLAPGQTSGSLVVDYFGDKLDGPKRQLTLLAAFPRSGVMTDQYLGRLVILDDDPTPKVTMSPVHRRVKEGTSAMWQVTLAKPVSYGVFVWLRPVAGGVHGPRLAVGDVPRDWLRAHGVPRRVSASTPLHRAKLGVYAYIKPGRTSTTLAIPTLRDGTKEGREAVTARIVADMAGHRLRATKTIYVVDR